MRAAFVLAIVAACARTTPLAVVAPVGPQPLAIEPTIHTTEELQQAIASGPKEVFLAPGTYRGPIVVKRPMAIIGTKDVIIDGGHAGTVVAIESNDVTISNVTVRASGRRHTAEDAGIKGKGDRIHVSDVRVEDTLFGIALDMCHFCSIERAHVVGPGDLAELRGDGVKLWESNDSIVRDTLVENARDVVVWYTRRALLDGLTVRGGRYGSHFMYAHDSTIRNCRYERDIVGVFVMYSTRITLEDDIMAGAHGAAGVGIGFKDSDAITLRRVQLVANTTGAYIDDTPRTEDKPLSIEEGLFALNQVALGLHTSGAGLKLEKNRFDDNAELVRVDGGGDALAAKLDGNHFSDYQGYDLDGDDIGDVPYEVKQLSHELTDAKPSLRLFQGTVALGTIDAVARAAPVLAAKKIVVDPHPRIR